MNEKDLRIETFSNSSPEVSMRITHIPTGEIIDGIGNSSHKLKLELMSRLKIQVERNILREALEKIAKPDHNTGTRDPVYHIERILRYCIETAESALNKTKGE